MSSDVYAGSFSLVNIAAIKHVCPQEWNEYIIAARINNFDINSEHVDYFSNEFDNALYPGTDDADNMENVDARFKAVEEYYNKLCIAFLKKTSMSIDCEYFDPSNHDSDDMDLDKNPVVWSIWEPKKYIPAAQKIIDAVGKDAIQDITYLGY